jgi:acylphosphatase
MIRKTVYFSGHVQGVGFRWTTRRIAEGFDVAGYVKNLPDGRVELVVEGDRDQVDAMIDSVKDRMDRHIRDMKVDTSNGTGSMHTFEIRH